MNLSKNISSVVRAALLGGALSIGGAFVISGQGCSTVTPVRELHQQGVPYSIDEVLQAYYGEILPLYRDDNQDVQFANFNNNKEGIFRLMEMYLSEVDEQTVSSATDEQQQALSVAYSDYSVAIALVNGRAGLSDALPIMERAIELDPHNPVFYYQYAQLLVNNERFSDALRALDNCIALDPTNEGACTAKQRLEQYINEHQ